MNCRRKAMVFAHRHDGAPGAVSDSDFLTGSGPDYGAKRKWEGQRRSRLARFEGRAPVGARGKSRAAKATSSKWLGSPFGLLARSACGLPIWGRELPSKERASRLFYLDWFKWVHTVDNKGDRRLGRLLQFHSCLFAHPVDGFLSFCGCRKDCPLIILKCLEP